MFEEALRRIEANLKAWKEGLRDPGLAQQRTLERLISGYVKTEYGRNHEAQDITNIDEYRRCFPVVGYGGYEPYLRRSREEKHEVLLGEEPLTWVMTRGSTGESKIIPVTPTSLADIVRCGSRGVLNFAMRNGRLTLLAGSVLNLQFPSNVRVLQSKGKEIVYGFSSGTYAKLNPMMAGLGLVPRQEEIDALQTDLTTAGWEKRYEYIYQSAKDKEIVSIIGVAPVQMGFARYLLSHHGVKPRDIWRVKVIYSTSVPKIHQEYEPKLSLMYGDAPVVEMYTATEGAYAQQLDEFPYVVPNYDTYLFEVKTGSGYKMLHEMDRGEWGKIIISSSILPRYEQGDLVEAMGKNYFRIFGRDKPIVELEHRLWRLTVGMWI